MTSEQTSSQAGDQDITGRLLARRYRLESVLGRGGMGTVWRAKDEVLGREVAVKQLRFTAGVGEDERHRLIARALTEAKAIARIRHTSAVTVYDVVEEDDRPWIVMELVESRSLSEVIREDGVLSVRRAAEIGLDLLGVLAEAHRSGILHRDVKPSNVLIGHDGRVVLTDFGIARVEGDPSVTTTGMLVGAPSYISPERARGGIPGAPADMWSLGATLYAMVDGYPPYDKGSALSTLTAVMTEELTPPRNGGALTPVIEGLLRKDPNERLDEAAARRMLRAVLAAPEPVAAELPEQRAALSEPTRVQPVPAVAAVPPPVPARAPAAGDTATAAAGAAAAPARRSWKPWLALLVALVLVAAGGVLIAVLAHQHGKKDGAGHKAGSVAGSAPASSARASAAAPPAASGSASASGSAAATSPAAGGAFRQVQGPGGSTLDIPAGWRVVSRSATSWKYKGPEGTLQIDATSQPGGSAVGAWRSEEAAIAHSFADYHRLRLETVSYRDGWDAADWEWTYASAKGAALHALNRGFVTGPKHGYAIYWTAPDASWSGARNQQLLSRFFSSFQPAG
ncbi:serine/threonine-protein kinase [Streptacidiphilus sp. N1-3]|uniref:non-specific serine/threonine protein kinase n=1 Tax=Streptacidiphilus alkalitolerans TaxID=3342712 RepID=A0ABV6X485_9ACTN